MKRESPGHENRERGRSGWPRISCSEDVGLSFLGDESLQGFCERVLAAVFEVQGKALRLSLRFCGDEEIAEVHERFFEDPSTTDVISFPLEEEDREGLSGPGRDALAQGELMVCVPFAIRKAKEVGNGVKEELALYLIHGCLHLLGFDDLDDESLEEMVREEKKCLERLGFDIQDR